MSSICLSSTFILLPLLIMSNGLLLVSSKFGKSSSIFLASPPSAIRATGRFSGNGDLYSKLKSAKADGAIKSGASGCASFQISVFSSSGLSSAKNIMAIAALYPGPASWAKLFISAFALIPLCKAGTIIFSDAVGSVTGAGLFDGGVAFKLLNTRVIYPCVSFGNLDLSAPEANQSSAFFGPQLYAISAFSVSPYLSTMAFK